MLAAAAALTPVAGAPSGCALCAWRIGCWAGMRGVLAWAVGCERGASLRVATGAAPAPSVVLTDGTSRVLSMRKVSGTPMMPASARSKCVW